MKKSIVSIMFVCLCFGYAVSEEQQIANNIPGKMVFSSTRSDDGKMYVYLLENGKIENLGFEAAAKFSPNGKQLALFFRNEVYIYDLKKKAVIKRYGFKYKQYFDGDWTKDGKYLIYGAKEELDKEKNCTIPILCG